MKSKLRLTELQVGAVLDEFDGMVEIVSGAVPDDALLEGYYREKLSEGEMLRVQDWVEASPEVCERFLSIAAAAGDVPDSDVVREILEDPLFGLGDVFSSVVSERFSSFIELLSPGSLVPQFRAEPDEVHVERGVWRVWMRLDQGKFFICVSTSVPSLEGVEVRLRVGDREWLLVFFRVGEKQYSADVHISLDELEGARDLAVSLVSK